MGCEKKRYISSSEAISFKNLGYKIHEGPRGGLYVCLDSSEVSNEDLDVIRRLTKKDKDFDLFDVRKIINSIYVSLTSEPLGEFKNMDYNKALKLIRYVLHNMRDDVEIKDIQHYLRDVYEHMVWTDARKGVDKLLRWGKSLVQDVEIDDKDIERSVKLFFSYGDKDFWPWADEDSSRYDDISEMLERGFTPIANAVDFLGWIDMEDTYDRKKLNQLRVFYAFFKMSTGDERKALRLAVGAWLTSLWMNANFDFGSGVVEEILHEIEGNHRPLRSAIDINSLYEYDFTRESVRRVAKMVQTVYCPDCVEDYLRFQREVLRQKFGDELELYRGINLWELALLYSNDNKLFATGLSFSFDMGWAQYFSDIVVKVKVSVDRVFASFINSLPDIGALEAEAAVSIPREGLKVGEIMINPGADFDAESAADNFIDALYMFGLDVPWDWDKVAETFAEKFFDDEQDKNRFLEVVGDAIERYRGVMSV